MVGKLSASGPQSTLAAALKDMGCCGAPAWTTEYLGLAVDELRAGGRRIDDDVLAHVSLRPQRNIGLYGTFSFEVATELAKLIDGYRPLRPARP